MISLGSHFIIYTEGILTERVTEEGVDAMVEGSILIETSCLAWAGLCFMSLNNAPLQETIVSAAYGFPTN